MKPPAVLLLYIFLLMLPTGLRISVVKIRASYVLSCLWNGAYKRTLAADQKKKPIWW